MVEQFYCGLALCTRYVNVCLVFNRVGAYGNNHACYRGKPGTAYGRVLLPVVNICLAQPVVVGNAGLHISISVGIVCGLRTGASAFYKTNLGKAGAIGNAFNKKAAVVELLRSAPGEEDVFLLRRCFKIDQRYRQTC